MAKTTDDRTRQMFDTAPHYHTDGMRLTDCCAATSTFMDTDPTDPAGYMLCCKVCYHPVPVGQGDGAEYEDGAR